MPKLCVQVDVKLCYIISVKDRSSAAITLLQADCKQNLHVIELRHVENLKVRGLNMKAEVEATLRARRDSPCSRWTQEKWS